jgi:hypothetical protein
MVRLPDLAKDRLTAPADRMERFAKGSVIYRVHPDSYSPVGGVVRFNDSDRGNARFSPIQDRAAKIIPILYAGVTYNCALMETVFHDVPIGTGPTTIDPAKLDSLVCSEVETLRDLLLIGLTSTGLRHFGLKNTDLIDTDPNTYPLTRAWAEALYERNPEAQGLFWTSRMQNRAQSFVLFGPRVDSPEYLRPVGDPQRLRQPDGTIDLEVLRMAKKIDVDFAS